MDMQTLSAVATEVLATLGETIKAARLRREWSVRNVAERVGVGTPKSKKTGVLPPGASTPK